MRAETRYQGTQNFQWRKIHYRTIFGKLPHLCWFCTKLPERASSPQCALWLVLAHLHMEACAMCLTTGLSAASVSCSAHFFSNLSGSQNLLPWLWSPDITITKHRVIHESREMLLSRAVCMAKTLEVYRPGRLNGKESIKQAVKPRCGSFTRVLWWIMRLGVPSSCHKILKKSQEAVIVVHNCRHCHSMLVIVFPLRFSEENVGSAQRIYLALGRD